MSVAIRAFEPGEETDVVTLWEAAGLTRPWNDPYADIRRKLTVQPELFLVATDGGAVVGSVMAGYDGHRGWLYYLATAPSHRGRGIARALVDEAERLLERMGCPKVQLMVRPDNVGARGLYDALGYESFDTWATGKRLIVDGPGGPPPAG
ncbi:MULTISPECIES: GNAT family acetyltransferase [Microbacterium]|uniref:GNAT family acetyltransferase n=1 Tax=Microbacterium TaxID=33882 RepID=UPI002788718C|nr:MULTISPECIES: GNAT family acetyltransferase [Microbacterium]MDQ1083518.1 ribosomal protein S18 acetylase RimI-like enzyme [Microbacterium sp. SORGH_AS_0344]MDQ1171205.1 ribosomal protein S18 acetylase RimI-like enzyme [Microbacterium proteolyticum]